jgi:hypothetical protein
MALVEWLQAEQGLALYRDDDRPDMTEAVASR